MLKKFSVFLLALVLMSSQAFAITYTVNSREDFLDSDGDSKVRIYGTIAFDSSYPYNATTNLGGEVLLPTQIGLSAINQLVVDPIYVRSMGSSGSIAIVRYHSSLEASLATTTSGIRVYSSMPNGITQSSLSGGIITVATYDLSALTAVPFLAIGDL